MKNSSASNIYDLSALAEILTKASSEIGIELGDREIRLFQKYYREIVFWNKRMNLVSQRSLEDLPIKHFIDSLTAAGSIVNKRGSLLDIGSGAGFPGIPLKIVFRDLKVTLLEASRKKASFLKNVVRTLGLQEIWVVNGRAEQLLEEKGYKDAFDIVISRAAFKLHEYLRLGAGFLSPTGILLAMKGPDVEAELKASRLALSEAGLKWSAWRAFRLPSQDAPGDERKILVFQKT